MLQSTVNFFKTNSSGGSVDVKQISKMNVISPHETIIDIPFTNSFKKLPLEVLKMKEGTIDIIETLCDFDNADETDFKNNKYTVFDGVMHLNTDYELKTVSTDAEDVYELDFKELNQFKKVNKIII